MRPNYASRFLLAFLLAFVAREEVCCADNPFVNVDEDDEGNPLPEGKKNFWVAGRPRGAAFPGSGGIKAVVIRVKDIDDNEIKLRVFAYRGFDKPNAPSRYTDMEELTASESLTCRVKQKNGRWTAALTAPDFKVYLTAMPLRGSEDWVVGCRVHFKKSPAEYGTCDEPPDDDILEEEDLNVDPDMDADDELPIEDPLYEENDEVPPA